MYGLLSNMMNNYRISNSTASREQFTKTKKLSNVGFAMLIMVEFLIMFMAIYAAWNLKLKMNWPSWAFPAVVLALFIPYIGDMLAIFIVVYWFTN